MQMPVLWCYFMVTRFEDHHFTYTATSIRLKIESNIETVV